jgi:hypothetical protein
MPTAEAPSKAAFYSVRGPISPEWEAARALSLGSRAANTLGALANSRIRLNYLVILLVPTVLAASLLFYGQFTRIGSKAPDLPTTQEKAGEALPNGSEADGKVAVSANKPDATEPDPEKFITSAELLLPRGSTVAIPKNQKVDVVVDVRIGNDRFRFTSTADSFWLLTKGPGARLFLVRNKNGKEPELYGFGVDKSGLEVEGKSTETYTFEFNAGTIKKITIKKP